MLQRIILESLITVLSICWYMMHHQWNYHWNRFRPVKQCLKTHCKFIGIIQHPCHVIKHGLLSDSHCWRYRPGILSSPDNSFEDWLRYISSEGIRSSNEFHRIGLKHGTRIVWTLGRHVLFIWNLRNYGALVIFNIKCYIISRMFEWVQFIVTVDEHGPTEPI